MGVVLVSLLAATAATFTNGNGITIWPVLITLAVLAKLPLRLVGTYAIGLACIVPSYLIGYHSPSQHASPMESIYRPRLVLEYIANYFGGGVMPDSAIIQTRAIGVAPAIGLLGLIAAIILILRLIMQKSKKSCFEFALAGIILYSVATALITSLGRLNFGTIQAFTSRYQSFALLFWLALSLWIISIAARQPTAICLITVYLLIVVTACYSLTQYGRILERVRRNRMATELAGVAMITGVHDDELLRATILPFPIRWSEVEELRTRQLSLFSMPRATQFGQDFAHVYPAGSSDACQGEVNVASYVGGNAEGVGVFGWAVERNTRNPVHDIVFVAEGKIVGFGVLGPKRPDVANALHSEHALHSGWVGYAKLNGSRTLDVYAVLPSGHKDSCHFAGIRIDSIR